MGTVNYNLPPLKEINFVHTFFTNNDKIDTEFHI